MYCTMYNFHHQREREEIMRERSRGDEGGKKEANRGRVGGDSQGHQALIMIKRMANSLTHSLPSFHTHTSTVTSYSMYGIDGCCSLTLNRLTYHKDTHSNGIKYWGLFVIVSGYVKQTWIHNKPMAHDSKLKQLQYIKH